MDICTSCKRRDDDTEIDGGLCLTCRTTGDMTPAALARADYTPPAPLQRVEVNQWGEITCLCRNIPSYDGFSACHSNGAVDDDLLLGNNSRPVFYLCERCGRIIEETTLEVIGRRGQFRSGPNPFATFSGVVSMVTYRRHGFDTDCYSVFTTDLGTVFYAVPVDLVEFSVI